MKNLSKSSFFLLIVIIIEECSSEISRPRGVSLSRAALYDPGHNFICFDNSKSIPFSHVNDDYCDCADGSDEPGTSACLNGIFHCANAGHKPQNLPSSRVNDGVCDCCDGSDEYSGNTVACSNICLQLGQFAREEAQKMEEILKVGRQLRLDLSQKGAQLKEEKKTNLADLEKNREEALKVKDEKQKIKDEIEVLEGQALDVYRKLEEEEKKKKVEAEALKNRKEATDTFTKFDSNQDGFISIDELQVRQAFDKDKNGEVSIEEAKYFLNNEESLDLENFISTAWPNIKPYLLLDTGIYKPPESHEPDHTQEHEKLDEEHEEEEEEEGDEEDEQSEHEQEAVKEEPASQLTYDEETQKLVDDATFARNEFAEAERAVKDIDNQITSIKTYLDKDLGDEEEFAYLEGQCFEYGDHEYIYRLCPFDKTTQQSKASSSETRLGSWGKWNGPEDNKYNAMLYEGGQSCWNGPTRSTQVRIVCGLENQVTSVSEPNKCEYLFEFSTPAACREIVNEVDDLHDEL